MDTDGTVSEVKVAHTGDPEVCCNKFIYIVLRTRDIRKQNYYYGNFVFNWYLPKTPSPSPPHKKNKRSMPN